jgi:hypothetical protein
MFYLYFQIWLDITGRKSLLAEVERFSRRKRKKKEREMRKQLEKLKKREKRRKRRKLYVRWK